MQDLANSAGDLNAQLAAIKASATQAGSTLDTSMAAGAAGITTVETEAAAAAVTVQDLGVKAKATGGFFDKPLQSKLYSSASRVYSNCWGAIWHF